MVFITWVFILSPPGFPLLLVPLLVQPLHVQPHLRLVLRPPPIQLNQVFQDDWEKVAMISSSLKVLTKRGECLPRRPTVGGQSKHNTGKTPPSQTPPTPTPLSPIKIFSPCQNRWKRTSPSLQTLTKTTMSRFGHR